jgi:MoaA/NifB/PqqE/SkfB family radical SAM enzyme
MNLDYIKKIELEITSNCNAACPGCARTLYSDLLTINTITFEDIKRIFPSKEYIENKQFKFCGVLGDPAFNPECLDMVKYLVSNGGFCQISTNGGIQSAKWWEELGRISLETKLLEVNFCIDGYRETNHIYRINTNFDVIERNMEAYSMGGLGFAQATWIYIVFDHNEYELEKAEEHARDLGFRFATRTGMRNSMGGWVAQIKKKNEELNKVITETKLITVSGDKEHENKDKVKELEKFIKGYTGISYESKRPIVVNNFVKVKKKREKVIPIIDDQQKQEILSSMQCKLIHEGEIFIASDLSVWPCCFLWDSYFKDEDDIRDRLKEYGEGWNSLLHNDLNKILDHEWFKYVLPQSWDPSHEKHFYRCIRTCSFNKAYQNIIKIKEYNE